MNRRSRVMVKTGHSKKYELIKNYYDSGLWDINRVRAVTEHGWITAEEFEEITGQPFNT